MLWRRSKYLNGCPLIPKPLLVEKHLQQNMKEKNDLHYMYQQEVIKKSYEKKTEGVIFKKVRQK